MKINTSMINKINTILATAILNKVFNLNDTGMSYYNNFLNDKDAKYMKYAKGKIGTIQYMPPDVYIEKCAYDIFNSTVEKTLRGINDINIDKYAEQMKNGEKFDLPVLDYADKTQEGRHRALAMKKLGVDLMPVLVVRNCNVTSLLRLPPYVFINGIFLGIKDENGSLIYYEPMDMHMEVKDLTDDFIKEKALEVIDKLKKEGKL
jgi:hypothetical protein